MSSNGQPLIQARSLVKRFDDFVAVDGIDFDLQREAFGFGPNGAGKTSTMRMIGCVSPATDGTLSVLGMDPARDGSKIRARLGVVPQQDTLDMELTVRENIVIYGRYFGLPRKELGARADSSSTSSSSRSARTTRSSRSRRDEAPPHDRTLARERARGAAPRRADDRARPAGAPCQDRLYRLKRQGSRFS